MDDSLLVGVLHGLADPRHELESAAQVEPDLGRVAIERASAHQLHGEVGFQPMTRILRARLVHLRDPRMLESPEQVRFLLEPSQ